MSKSCLVRRGKPGGCSPDHLVAVAGAPLNLATALSTPAKARWSAEGSWACYERQRARSGTRPLARDDRPGHPDRRGHRFRRSRQENRGRRRRTSAASGRAGHAARHDRPAEAGLRADRRKAGEVDALLTTRQAASATPAPSPDHVHDPGATEPGDNTTGQVSREGSVATNDEIAPPAAETDRPLNRGRNRGQLWQKEDKTGVVWGPAEGPK